MVQRRTRALAELVMSTISLPVCIYLWKLPSKYADEMEELDEIDPPRLSLPALAAGAIDGTIERWLSDRDVFQIRTNRWRGILFSFRGVVQGRLIKRYASDPNSFQYSRTIGSLLGIIGYRLWYGLLHPLPEEKNQTSLV